MKEPFFINEDLTETFRNLGCGNVKVVYIYRTHGDKIFFRAGTGKFHMTRDELNKHALAPTQTTES